MEREGQEKSGDNAQGCSVGLGSAGQFHFLDQPVGNQKYVQNVVARKQQGGKAQQYVAAEQIHLDVLGFIHLDGVAAGRPSQQVDGNDAQSRRSVAHHASPLQVSRQAQSQRMNTEQVGTYQHVDEHEGVEYAHGLGHVVVQDVAHTAAVHQGNEQKNPCLGQEPHVAA